MIDSIKTFLDEENYRLVLRTDGLHAVDKRELGLLETIQAWFGCGNASLRKVCTYINEHHKELLEGMVNEESWSEIFADKIITYNKTRTWKHKKVDETFITIMSEFRREKILIPNVEHFLVFRKGHIIYPNKK